MLTENGKRLRVIWPEPDVPFEVFDSVLNVKWKSKILSFITLTFNLRVDCLLAIPQPRTNVVEEATTITKITATTTTTTRTSTTTTTTATLGNDSDNDNDNDDDNDD